MPRPVVVVELDVDGSGLFATDISAYVDLKRGIPITRGRGDESADVEASTCSMTLDNTSGVFSYGASKVTNLLTNGSFEAPLLAGLVDGWWDVNTAAYSVARTTTAAKVGANSLMMTSTDGTLTQMTTHSSIVPVTAGKTYTLSGWYKAGATPRSMGPYFEWTPGGQNTSGTHPAMSEVGTGWTFFTITAVAPVGATGVSIWVNVNSSVAMPVNEKHYLDGLSLEEGAVAHPYFEGSAPFTIALDMPIRVTVTTGATVSRRFTGHVTTWPVAWPGGHRSSVATITATDRLVKLARRRLRSVIEQTTLETKPRQYFVLGEGETSTTVGDTAGYGGPSLAIGQRGAGGTLALGAGTGPAFDSHTAPVLTRAGEFAGKYLSGPGLGESLIDFTVRVVVASTLVAEQTFLRIDQPAKSPTNGFEIGCNAAGHLVVKNGTYWSVVHAVNMCTGATQDIVVTGTAVATPSYHHDLTVYKNGVVVATDEVYPVSLRTERISIGGGALAGYQNSHPVPLASATLSHVAVWNRAVTATDATRMRQGITDGFKSDSSSERIARYALWAGLTSTEQVLEAGALADVAHLDTDGMSPVEAMQTVARSDQGLVFIDGSGVLRFHTRTHRYSPTTDVTLTAPDVGVDAQFTLDTQGLVNLVTAQRPEGARQTVRNDPSIALFDEFPEDLTLLVLTDEEALQAASWRATVHAYPSARLGSLTVDLLTQTSALALAVQALTIGDVLALTGLPDQAPLSASRLFVEGWTEQIGTDDWSMTFNTSPLDVVVWKLEDPLYGAIDAINRIAY